MDAAAGVRPIRRSWQSRLGVIPSCSAATAVDSQEVSPVARSQPSGSFFGFGVIWLLDALGTVAPPLLGGRGSQGRLAIGSLNRRRGVEVDVGPADNALRDHFGHLLALVAGLVRHQAAAVCWLTRSRTLRSSRQT